MSSGTSALLAALLGLCAMGTARADVDPSAPLEAVPPVAPVAPVPPVAPVAPVAAEGDFEALRAKGAELFRADRYEEAARSFEAAYAIRQIAELLFDLGRTRERLGQTAQAISYYQSFLVAQPDLDPARRSAVEANLQRLHLLLGPAPVDAAGATFASQRPDAEVPPAYRFELRPDSRLTGPGAGIFVASYVPALLIGMIGLGNVAGGAKYSTAKGDVPASAGVLLIPGLGPFLSGLVYRSADWSLPWILVDGLGQVAGVAMMAAGVKWKRKVRVFVPPGETWNVLPYRVADGGGLVLTGRF